MDDMSGNSGLEVIVDRRKVQWTIYITVHVTYTTEVLGLRMVHKTKRRTTILKSDVLEQNMKPPLQGRMGSGDLEIFEVTTPSGDLEQSEIGDGTSLV